MLLGIPVVGVSAGKNRGLDQLRETIREVKDGFLAPKPCRATRASLPEYGGRSWNQTHPPGEFVKRAEAIACEVTVPETSGYCKREERIDRILSKGYIGIPLMVLFLLAIFWLTIQGANYPSQLLQSGFDRLGLLLAQRAGLFGGGMVAQRMPARRHLCYGWRG